MFCSHCGFKLEEADKFCPKCGTLQKKNVNDSIEVVKHTENEFTELISETESKVIEKGKDNGLSKNHIKPRLNTKVILFGAGIIAISVLIFFLAYTTLGNKKAGDSTISNKNLSTNSKDLASISKDSENMKIIDISTADFPSINLKVKVSSNSKISGVDVNSFNILEKGDKQTIKSFSENNNEENTFTITYDTNGETFDNKNKLVEVTLTNNKIEYSASLGYQLPNPIASKISINQIDSSNFPEISVYFTAEDNKGEILKSLQKQYIKIKESNSTALVEEDIEELRQMNLKQSLNINLVMDTSDSMSGYKINTAKDAALKFLNSVQFDSGDLVELITFNDRVYIGQTFTNQRNSIEKALIGLNTSSQTAFYDALNTSLVETSEKVGPKCIIAFTDGLDNQSKISSDYVIDLAKKLGIPIYIIGIGSDVDNNTLNSICEKTGGYFTQISDVEKLKQIYDDIFKKQKEQYILTYKTKNNIRDGLFRNINLELNNVKYSGDTSNSYVPKYAIDPNINPSTGYNSQYGLTDIEKAMYDYQYNFVKAVNSYDFSNLSQYIDPNGPLYNMQKKLIDFYKSEGIQEKLIFYSIEATNKINDNQYQIVVHEKFYITYNAKTPALTEYRVVYTVKNTSNGFKVSDLTELKVLNSISVNY